MANNFKCADEFRVSVSRNVLSRLVVRIYRRTIIASHCVASKRDCDLKIAAKRGGERSPEEQGISLLKNFSKFSRERERINE